jgi:hypothetical protein
MLIGIYSPAAGSGKSAIADHLITHHNFARLSFAEPLKDMVRVLLENFGYSPTDAHDLTHIHKDAPIYEIDSRIDSRHLLRTIGTEWGRACIHTDIWLRCWTARYMRLTSEGYDRIVVDDMRFLNEANLLARLDAQLWSVVRTGTPRSTAHASEGGLDSLKLLSDPTNDCSLGFHHLINNDGTLGDLHFQVNAILTTPQSP